MKKLLSQGVALLLGLFAITSCSGGDEGEEAVTNEYIRLASGGADIALTKNETSKSVVIQSNCSWNVSITENANWSTLRITTSTSGSGNQNIELTTDANTTRSKRTAKLTFTKSSGNVSFSITQEAGDVSFSVSPKEWEFPASGGEYSFTIDGNIDWNVSAPEWCTLDKTQGSGAGKLTVTVGENPNTTARDGQIIFSGERSATINISQQGKAYSLTVSTNAFNMDALGGDYEITVTCNGSWRINVDNTSWCSVDKNSGSANASGEKVKVTIKPNTTTEERKANITIVAGNDAKTETVSVTQLAGSMPEVTLPQYEATSSSQLSLSATFSSMFDVTEYGFCYGTSANPTQKVKVGENGGKSGEINTTLTLEDGNIYYIRSYATSAVGTTYSDDVTVEMKGKQPGKDDNPSPNDF